MLIIPVLTFFVTSITAKASVSRLIKALTSLKGFLFPRRANPRSVFLSGSSFVSETLMTRRHSGRLSLRFRQKKHLKIMHIKGFVLAEILVMNGRSFTHHLSFVSVSVFIIFLLIIMSDNLRIRIKFIHLQRICSGVLVQNIKTS